MLAILQNPYAPYRIAFALAYLLSQTELEALMKIESLSPNLKGMVRVLSRNRKHGQSSAHLRSEDRLQARNARTFDGPSHLYTVHRQRASGFFGIALVSTLEDSAT